MLLQEALVILRSSKNRAELKELRGKQGGGSTALSFDDGVEMIYNPEGRGRCGVFHLYIPVFGIVYEHELKEV
jgi:hypothetical protein